MTFTGFNIKYPEYEVVTPQTKHSFTLRSLNVQEEEKLKGSMISPQKIAEHLNQCLFDSLVKKPEVVKNLDTFLRNVTLKDRDALLYGLYHVTYEEIRNYELKCGSCSKQYPVTVKASDTFNFVPYPRADILKARIKVELPASPGVSATIKQPTLFDEVSSMRTLSSRPNSTMDLITETLIIESFEENVPEKTEELIYKDKADIIDAYLTLPAKDKRAIYRAYDEQFGKFGVKLKMKSYCPACGVDEDHDIDLVENFFRSLYGAE